MLSTLWETPHGIIFLFLGIPNFLYNSLLGWFKLHGVGDTPESYRESRFPGVGYILQGVKTPRCGELQGVKIPWSKLHTPGSEDFQVWRVTWSQDSLE